MNYTKMSMKHLDYIINMEEKKMRGMVEDYELNIWAKLGSKKGFVY